MITVANFKEHARIDSGDVSQDNVIAIYVDAAKQHVCDLCDRQFFSDAPKPVIAAALLIANELYEFREGASDKQIRRIETVANLLNPYRDYTNHFGGGELVPPTMEVDLESIVKFDDWSKSFRYRDESGAGINVTGASVVFELMQCDAVKITQACVINDALNGLMSVDLTDVQTGSLSVGMYWYRVRIAIGAIAKTIARVQVGVIK